ncbi:MAG TPA: SpoIIE family protein phosphatase [Solirubrobacteraceae bacterium]|nr:SpoIIE family protein phosphatase [Solirubrobacteraceae bacterium]
MNARPDSGELHHEGPAVALLVEAVLENVAEAITVVDASGRTVFANRAALELLGLESEAELTQAEPGEIMSRFLVLDETGAELDLASMPGRRLFDGEPAIPLLVRNIVRATGEERWFVVRASPIVDPESREVLYAANVFENVTQVKRAQLAEAFMAQASRVLASSMDYNETLQRIARLAATQIAECCAVDVLGERGQLERVAVDHADPDKLALVEHLDRSYRPALDEPLGVPEVIRSGQAKIYRGITDRSLAAYARDSNHLELLRSLRARDVIIVPLAAPARTLGTITLVSSNTGRRLTEADLDLAVRLGRRAGTAVESARLYTERAHIAHSLQRALMPYSLPEIPGFELAASYRAAGELNEVGGDFYDVYPSGAEHWVLVIGDVCGKGPDAAGVTALARHTLRTASMFDPSPATMVRTLHRALLQQLPGQQMCTVCVVSVGAPRGTATLRLALGGHPQPLLIDSGGRTYAVGEPGTALGLVEPINVTETAFELHPGETLLLYTDGVPETWRSRFEHTSPLMRLCEGAPGQALSELLAGIESAALASAAGAPRDDMALLGLRLASTRAR